MDIFLRESVIGNLSFSDEEIAVYVALRSIFNWQRQFQTVSYNLLCYELYNKKPSQKSAEAVKTALHSLMNRGLVKIVQQFSSTEFSVDLSALFFDDDYYTVIRLDEVHKIMNVDGRTDKFKLLRYYITCLRTINRSQGVYDGVDTISNFCGYMPQSYLGSSTGINPDSSHLKLAEQYNAILEENELLYVYRHNKIITDENGQPKNINNHYGRWEHKENIKKFALQYEAEHGLIEDPKSTKINNHRRLAACYNNLMSDFKRYSKQYSQGLLIEIYDYISDCNMHIRKEMKSVGKENPYYKDLERRLRDESLLLELPCVQGYINNI